MIFPAPLQRGILLTRYKRFLADVRLEDGSKLTVHCPNSGSMRTCSTPGSEVCISTSSNLKRKYPHTLEMIKSDATWVGINTARTNHLVREGINQGDIAELAAPDLLRPEIKTSAKSRLDLLFVKGDREIYIEIKSCTLVEYGCAMFPDAVTARGTKHLLELASLVRQGKEGCIFFLVQRLDADVFRPAGHIDPLYAETLAQVHGQGVGILVYQADVQPGEIKIVRSLPFSL